MDDLEEFMKKTECPVNWSLQELEMNQEKEDLTRADFFKKKLEVSDSMEFAGDPIDNWPLRLVYAFELCHTDPSGAISVVDEIIQEILASDDTFTNKYQVPFLHIIYGTKALMLLRRNPKSMDEVERFIHLTKPKSGMSDVELSGLLAMKAHMLRLYGPDGTHKGVPLLREAIRKNSHEAEWSLSLVISMHRIRHYIKGRDTPWSKIAEPVNILEDLLNHPDLTPKQKVSCKYYLAVAYYDYILGKHVNNEIRSCQKQIKMLCEDVYRQTDHPQVLEFCAQQFDSDLKDSTKSMDIIDEGLRKFPNHVGINTTACKIFKKRRYYALAAKHAQTALDNGGYGAAWLLLECKVMLKEVFDEDEFFKNLISTFPTFYNKQTYVAASMYFFFQKRNIIKGAANMELAIMEDPNFNGIHGYNYILWCGRKARPIEVAYNQIIRGLREAENNPTLLSARRLIEEVANVSDFNIKDDLITRNLVGPMRRNYRN